MSCWYTRSFIFLHRLGEPAAEQLRRLFEQGMSEMHTQPRSEVVPLTAMAKSCLCMYRIDNIFSPKMYGLCVWFARCPIRVTYANCIMRWMCMLKCALKHIYSFCWLIMLRNTLKEQHNCCVSWWMIKKTMCRCYAGIVKINKYGQNG